MIRLAGCKALMPGYHAVHGTKCVANSEILNDIFTRLSRFRWNGGERLYCH